MAAGKKFSDLDPITAAQLQADDLFCIESISGVVSKKMTKTEMLAAFNAVPNLTIQSKTGVYTILATDDLVLGDTTSTAFTLTMPTAVGNDGKTIKVKKTNSTLNKLTVDGAGSETVAGLTSFFMLGHGESVTLVSDGTNWIEVEWDEGEEIQGACVFGEENNIDENQFSITFKRQFMYIHEGHTTWTGSGGTSAVVAWTLPGSLSIATGKRVGGTNTLNHDATVYGVANVFTTAWVNYSVQYNNTTSVRFRASSVNLAYSNLTASDSIRFSPGVKIPIA